MKKFLIILSALLLCITPFFAIHSDNDLKVYASYNNTYNYTAEISTNYPTTFLEGIDSVESVNFDYLMYYSINYPTPIPFKILMDCGNNFGYQGAFNLLCFQMSRYDYVDYDYRGLTNSLLIWGNFRVNTYDYGYASITGTISKVVFTDCYVDAIANGLNNPFPYCDYTSQYSCTTYRNYSCSSEDLSQFLDMNSETNFNFDYQSMLTYVNQSSLYNIIDFFTLKQRDMYCGNLLDCVSSFHFSFHNGGTYSANTISSNSHYFFSMNLSFNTATYSDYDYEIIESGCVIKDFEIIVNKPVIRLDNTLVLYNYNYDCAISSISSIEYCLSKDNDLYKAKYTGSLPNNKFIGVVSGELQNRIYDEYIYIYLTFNGNKVNFDSVGNFALGFDFNFSRYYEPFVIKGSELNNYNLPTLNKPDDWHDFGGWIRYGFVWFIFYNPVIAPISKFIVSIFGVFINVFKFILGFELGAFLLAFIGFIIIYNLFVSISPIQSAWKGVGAIDNELDNYRDDYRKYKEEHKFDKVHNNLRDTNKVSKMRNKVKDKWRKNSIKVQKKLDKKRNKK